MNPRRAIAVEHNGFNRQGHILATVVWETLVPNMASIRFVGGMYDRTPELVPVHDREPLAFSSEAALHSWLRDNS